MLQLLAIRAPQHQEIKIKQRPCYVSSLRTLSNTSHFAQLRQPELRWAPLREAHPTTAGGQGQGRRGGYIPSSGRGEYFPFLCFLLNFWTYGQWEWSLLGHAPVKIKSIKETLFSFLLHINIRVLQNDQKFSKLSKLFTPHLYHPNDHPRLFKYHQDAFSRPRVRVAIFAEIAY